MRLLIAPAHYVLDPTGGSEYTRAYEYLRYLGAQPDIEGIALAAYCKYASIGNIRVISFLGTKPDYISITMRLRFIWWVYQTSRRLLQQEQFDCLWHNAPFALGETFSLAILMLSRQYSLPSVIGPIPSPHSLIGADEGRSMGRKSAKPKTIWQRAKTGIEQRIYFVSRIFQPFSRWTLQTATQVLAADTNARHQIAALGTPDVLHLPFVVNRSWSKATPKPSGQTLKLINVSYLVERKRTIDLIEAMNIVVKHRHIKTVQLTIVGDGPQFARIKQLVNQYRLGSFVTLLGYRDYQSVEKLYQAADVFISASVSESMAAMYFEAMAAGLPIISARNHNTDDLCANNAAVTVTEPANPGALANAIINAAQDQSLAAQGSQNHSVLLKNYDFQTNMDELIDVLHKASSSRPALPELGTSHD